MESRWYSLPGQAVENKKISDQSHPLDITQSEWNKITDHLMLEQKIVGAVEGEKAQKRALKKGYDGMIKNWPDSFEHVHLHQQEERRKLAEVREKQRTENFIQLRKEQPEIKDEFLGKVTFSMLYEKAYPKSLSGTWMLSEVLEEHEKQKEFKKILGQCDIEEERKYAESANKGDEDEKREKQEEAEEVRKKKLELIELYLKQILKEEEALEMNTEEPRKPELIDKENGSFEIELEALIRLGESMAIRAEGKREVAEYLTVSNEYKRMPTKEDDEIAEFNRVFENAKHEIECLNKEKLEGLQHRRQQVARRDEDSQKVIAEAKAKDEAFERSIKLAQEEANAREEAKNQERIKRRRQLRKDCKEDQINYLESKAEQDTTVFEQKIWNMLNRLRFNEAIKEYNEDKLNDKWDKSMKYREELLEQISRKELVDDSEQEFINTLKNVKETDDDFFRYADQLIDNTMKNNKPMNPIMEVVTNYKKNNRLRDEKKTSFMSELPDETIMNGDVKMVDVPPGKMAHDPKTDLSYLKYRCCKDWIIQ